MALSVAARYAETGFSIADTPPELNAHLFREMMRKTGAERLIIGCQVADTARAIVNRSVRRGSAVSMRPHRRSKKSLLGTVLRDPFSFLAYAVSSRPRDLPRLHQPPFPRPPVRPPAHSTAFTPKANS